VVGAISVLALVAWTLHVWQGARRHAFASARNEVARVAQTVARDQEHLIDSARQLVLGLAQRQDVQAKNSGACAGLVESIVRTFLGYLDVIATRPDGAIFCSARPEATAAAVVDPADVARAVQTGEALLGRYRIDPAAGRAVITLTAPAVDGAGVVRAVVIVAIDLAWLGRTLVETPLPPGASLALVDRRGIVLVHVPEPERWVGEFLDEKDHQQLLAAGDDGVETTVLGGHASLAVTAPLLRDPERAGDATVVVALPMRVVADAVYRAVSRHLTGLFVVAALALITIGLAFELFVVRPAWALSRILWRLRRGETKFRVRGAYGWGALHPLARSVENLARLLELRGWPAIAMSRTAVAGRPIPFKAPTPVAPVVRAEAAPNGDLVAATGVPAVAPRDDEVGLTAPAAAVPAPPASVVDALPRDAARGATTEAYWELTEPAFDNSPNPRFLYLSPTYEGALLRLTYAVRQRRGCATLIGESGCGKTVMLRALIGRLEPDRYEVGLITNPAGAPHELLRQLLYELGNQSRERRRPEMLRLLNDILAENLKNNRDTVIVVDDAQLVSDSRWFEELGLLLNVQTNERALVTIVLAGTPELGPKVQEVKHLHRRIGIHSHLSPLDSAHTAKYVEHRLRVAGRVEPIFTPEALRVVFELAQGTARDVNDVCDAALMVGALSNVRQIDGDLVRRVAGPGRKPADGAGIPYLPSRQVRRAVPS
jgi:general secretion pathway protein A